MKYSKEEYDKMVKIHQPMDDAYITGKRPEVINKMRASINKVKTIQYLCEEVIVEIEETILEVNKL
jgi:predicted transcriptional regulator